MLIGFDDHQGETLSESATGQGPGVVA